MGDRIKVKIKDQEVEGELINIKSAKEDWNEYVLEDGTKIKLKVVVSKIIRTDLVDDSGDPVYVVNSTNVVDALVPENLKAPQKRATDKNVQ